MARDPFTTTDERDVIVLALSDPPRGEKLAAQLGEYFNHRYRVVRASTAREARETLGELADASRRTVVLFAEESLPEGPSGLELLRDESLAGVAQGRLLLADEPERALRDLADEEGAAEVVVAPRSPSTSRQEPSDDPFWEQAEKVLYLAAPSGETKAEVYGDPKTDVVFRAKRFLRLNHVAVYPKGGTAYEVVPTKKGVQGTKLVKPTLSDLAQALLDYTAHDPDTTYDLAVVGGGPAAMCAAVNAHALYGMSTVIVENFAPGGTAATANNTIENYLGFPDGIRPDKLSQEWLKHTEKYKVAWLHTHTATKLAKPAGGGEPYTLTAEKSDKAKTSTTVKAKTVLIACGMQTPRQGGENEAKFRYKGVYYDALPADGPDYKGKTVAVIGGGDTAGRAVDIFATCGATKIYLILRGTFANAPMLKDIKKLVEEHKAANKVDMRENTEVVKYEGGTHLEKLTLTSSSTPINVDAAFVLIGGKPNTGWLKNKELGLYLDAGGYVQTTTITLGKEQAPLATNLPGVFAAGDVRGGATRRIAAAVGDGGTAALSIYHYRKHNP